MLDCLYIYRKPYTTSVALDKLQEYKYKQKLIQESLWLLDRYKAYWFIFETRIYMNSNKKTHNESKEETNESASESTVFCIIGQNTNRSHRLDKTNSI